MSKCWHHIHPWASQLRLILVSQSCQADLTGLVIVVWPCINAWRPWRSPALVGKLLKFLLGLLYIHKQGAQPPLSLSAQVDHQCWHRKQYLKFMLDNVIFNRYNCILCWYCEAGYNNKTSNNLYLDLDYTLHGTFHCSLNKIAVVVVHKLSGF